MMADLRTRLHAKVLMPLAYRMMRDRRFELIDALLARDAWSREEIRTHQAKQLARLFRICRDHNGYWQTKFVRHGVNPDGSNPHAELAKLPILTKDEVRANWRAMRSSHLPDSHVVLESSGGSTGKQVNLYQSRYYRTIHAANEYRSRAWMGLQPGEPYLCIQANGAYIRGQRRLLRTVRTAMERGFLIDGLQIDPSFVRGLLREAAARRPVHVFGYTTPMVAIARIARELKLDWNSVRAVSTTAERLFDADRAILEETYGAPVFDRYGSREVNSISMQCTAGCHHIFADLNVVEFLPIDDAEEDMNAVIVTPLDNEAMPLFRYRSGDEAAPIDGECICGRALPLMSGCRGRIANNFVTTDGRLINGGYFSRFFHGDPSVRSFQFHQTDVRHIDIYVALDGPTTSEQREQLERIRKQIDQDYPNQFETTLHLVDHIPPRKSGKHLFTISDVLLNQ
ncbi:MAG: phenylacetate--CoA ligase family protein [Phycisphaerae bacterium]|nr:phenylacetate--CoA ligase family protein [Phycisphaerae bacterium]